MKKENKDNMIEIKYKPKKPREQGTIKVKCDWCNGTGITGQTYENGETIGFPEDCPECDGKGYILKSKR